MPRIAAHCQPGSVRGNAHTLECQWPDTVYVQWGGHGIVINDTGGYETAFFEAFPDGGGFIRGEGKTIGEAERKAFAQYQKEAACQHVWGRRTYLNGGGICLKCKGFGTNKFQPIMRLGEWRKPLSRLENELLELWFRPDRGRPLDAEQQKMARKLMLRKRVFGADEEKPTIKDHIDMLRGKA